MSPIPTLTPDPSVELRLVLILFNLTPAALATWLQERCPSAERHIPTGWYGAVLLGVGVATFASLGSTPGFRGEARLAPMIALGLLLGVVVIAIDAGVLGVARRLRRTRTQPADLPSITGGRSGPIPGDIPLTTTTWRLRDQAPPCRAGLPALIAGACLEECIYRQALLELLAPFFRSSLWPAGISTLFFGLTHFHFGFTGVMSKWLIGAVLVAVVLTGHGLTPVIVAHVVLNGAAFAVRKRPEGTAASRSLVPQRA